MRSRYKKQYVIGVQYVNFSRLSSAGPESVSLVDSWLLCANIITLLAKIFWKTQFEEINY